MRIPYSFTQVFVSVGVRDVLREEGKGRNDVRDMPVRLGDTENVQYKSIRSTRMREDGEHFSNGRKRCEQRQR